MAWHIVFSKNPREALKNLGKIHMPKFLLNLLVEFLKSYQNPNSIDSSGFCPMDSRSLWLVIIPKSKDWFIKRPPMKTVQP
jgi:hypothetical protein